MFLNGPNLTTSLFQLKLLGHVRIYSGVFQHVPVDGFFDLRPLTKMALTTQNILYKTVGLLCFFNLSHAS